MEKYVKYKTSDVCCSMISYDIEGDTINNIIFYGGCPGGLSALAKALNGRKIEEVIDLMKNIKCGNRDSSCPVELVKSLRQELEIIKNLPEEAEQSYCEIIVNAYQQFVERTKIDLNKYKVILQIKPEIKLKWESEIDKLNAGNDETYKSQFKDITIIENSAIQDDFIFTSEKYEE